MKTSRAKRETWKQTRANIRASVCMRVRVRVRVCVRARALAPPAWRGGARARPKKWPRGPARAGGDESWTRARGHSQRVRRPSAKYVKKCQRDNPTQQQRTQDARRCASASSPCEVQVAGRLHAAAHECRARRAAPRLDQRRPAGGACVVAQLQHCEDQRRAPLRVCGCLRPPRAPTRPPARARTRA